MFAKVRPHGGLSHYAVAQTDGRDRRLQSGQSFQRPECVRARRPGSVRSRPIKAEVLNADAVILPGVGAFGDAMANLHKLDLVSPLRDHCRPQPAAHRHLSGPTIAHVGKLRIWPPQGPRHIRGTGRPLRAPQGPAGTLKVPQVGWNRISCPLTKGGPGAGWHASPLAGPTRRRVHVFRPFVPCAAG